MDMISEHRLVYFNGKLPLANWTFKFLLSELFYDLEQLRWNVYDNEDFKPRVPELYQFESSDRAY